jgi:hypothetical protein
MGASPTTARGAATGMPWLARNLLVLIQAEPMLDLHFERKWHLQRQINFRRCVRGVRGKDAPISSAGRQELAAH